MRLRQNFIWSSLIKAIYDTKNLRKVFEKHTNTMSTNRHERIDVADVLRGLAVMGIVILHCLEHFNFYKFPQTESALLQFSNTAIWNSTTFLLAGKAYGIFALLFGFSFYIQDSRLQEKGVDFRLRFMWRLLLLFLWGQFNAAFFTAEVLVLYALVGFVLPLFARCSNKTILIAATILMLQPLEIAEIIYAIFNPEYTPPRPLDSAYWGITFQAQDSGTFLETVRTNLWEGQLASLTWAWENARFFQTPALFLLGMWIGRQKLFCHSEKNINYWLAVAGCSIAIFFPLNGLSPLLGKFIANKAIASSATLIVGSLSKFAFMMLLVSATILLYYLSPLKAILSKIIPYGRMSLTNYITQSIIGSFIFYNWGLHLQLDHTRSMLVGIAIFIVQFLFARWWFRSHKQGPLEYIWKKATWIGKKQ